MVKKVSAADLAELSKTAEIEYDPEVHEVARFGELIDKLNELIASNAERTQADLARSQAQLEVLATLQKMIRQQNVTKSHAPRETIDLGPLRDMVAEIQQTNAQRAKTAYHFDIQRGEGGYMAGITATPIQATTH